MNILFDTKPNPCITNIYVVPHVKCTLRKKDTMVCMI